MTTNSAPEAMPLKNALVWLLLSVLVIVVDMITKQTAEALLEYANPVFEIGRAHV